MQPNGQRVKYDGSAIRGLAITQLVLGGLCVIFGIVSAVLYRGISSRFTGAIEIWMPLSFIVAGILGIVAASQGTNGMIVAHMVMSIIATVMAFSVFIAACVWAWLFKVTHIALAILSFAEFVVAIISAAFCCRAVCCRNSSTGGVVVAGQPQGGTVVVTSGQQVVYASQQPVVYAPQQPVVYQQHYVAQPGVHYAPAGQHVVQPGIQQQMPTQQYGVQQQIPPQQYPQATGQATAPIKPPEYSEQPM